MVNLNLRDPTIVLGNECVSVLVTVFSRQGGPIAGSFDRDSCLEALARRLWSLPVSFRLFTACIIPQPSLSRWEFVTTLDYEWRVFRGHLPYRWTIWVRTD